MKQGIFVSFEGGDGVGKSTVLAALKQQLEQLFQNNKLFPYDGFIISREPGGTFYGEKIRTVLIEQNEARLEPLTELFLFAAARCEHWYKLIAPALLKNQIVICDRYIDSSYVYQGLNANLGIEVVDQVNQLIAKELFPHITFYFDVDEQTLLKRMELRKKNNKINAFDDQTFQKIIQTKSHYQKVMDYQKKIHPNRLFYFINGSNPVSEIVSDIIKKIFNY